MIVTAFSSVVSSVCCLPVKGPPLPNAVSVSDNFDVARSVHFKDLLRKISSFVSDGSVSHLLL